MVLTLGITYQNETFLKRVQPLAKELNSELLIKCDFSNEIQILINVFKKFQTNGNLLILSSMLLLILIKQSLMEDILNLKGKFY